MGACCSERLSLCQDNTLLYRELYLDHERHGFTSSADQESAIDWLGPTRFASQTPYFVSHFLTGIREFRTANGPDAWKVA
jgi:hypothetical protein